MKTYTPREIIQHARGNSPFYKKLYAHLPEDAGLFSLPVLYQEEFWKANNMADNKLLAGALHDGIVFKSGGTTGAPKFSVYDKEEWEAFTYFFGQGVGRIGLEAGDRVGNLFYAGELYASFVFIMKSLEKCPVPILHFPLAGSTSPQVVAKTMREYGIDVLVGVPTTLLALAPELKGMKIRKMYFGGESLYPDQRAYLQGVFPGIELGSIGYASVDAGHLGYCQRDFAEGEHGVFDESSIMEILDVDNGEPITTTGRVGRLVYTNLARRLMPIIRYPVGDMGEWTEVGKRFLLLGRSDEGARIGPVTVNRDDVASVLAQLAWGKSISQFQLVIDRVQGKDRLTIRLGAPGIPAKEMEELFLRQRAMFQESVAKGLIAPLKVEGVLPDALAKNPRTGKLRLVIDQRFNS